MMDKAVFAGDYNVIITDFSSTYIVGFFLRAHGTEYIVILNPLYLV